MLPACVSHRRYEGEFDTGFANGMGQYTSTRGKVYRGEWLTGQKHGWVAGWVQLECSWSAVGVQWVGAVGVQRVGAALVQWAGAARVQCMMASCAATPEPLPEPVSVHGGTGRPAARVRQQAAAYASCHAQRCGQSPLLCAAAVWSTTPRPSSSAWRQAWTPTRCAGHVQFMRCSLLLAAFGTFGTWRRAWTPTRCAEDSNCMHDWLLQRYIWCFEVSGDPPTRWEHVHRLSQLHCKSVICWFTVRPVAPAPQPC